MGMFLVVAYIPHNVLSRNNKLVRTSDFNQPADVLVVAYVAFSRIQIENQ